MTGEQRIMATLNVTSGSPVISILLSVWYEPDANTVFCMSDVRCDDDPFKILTPFERNDVDDVQYDYTSDAILRYTCGSTIMEFDDGTSQYESFFTECLPQGLWNDTAIPTCVCKTFQVRDYNFHYQVVIVDHSCNFQDAPTGTNLVRLSAENQTLIGGNFTYECKPGMKFEDDPDRSILTATCLDGNILDPIGGWSNCVPSMFQ